MLYLFTFILAFCSISYELILAQSLSATLGSTVARYNSTIGLYILALGCGVLFYHAKMRAKAVQHLIHTEQALAIIGGFAPILVLCFNYITSLGTHIYYAELLLDYSLVFAIGFLSGFELPMLMDIGKKYLNRPNMTVLAIDYFGTTLGAFLFALFLLPAFGLFAAAFYIALLNSLTAVFLCILLKEHLPRQSRFLPLSVIIFCLLLILSYFHIPLSLWIQQQIYLS